MSYRPKYCCQCGEKIERIDWRFWHSRRFCELCGTEFWIYDWLPYLKGIGVLLVIFVTGWHFQKPEKTLNVAPNQFVSNSSKISANQNAAVQFPNANSVQTAELTKTNPQPLKSPTALKVSETKVGQPESSTTESSEKVYFCGAATKKGTPCSRRVRGGGRCWQHEGQAAMMAQEKLIANQ